MSGKVPMPASGEGDGKGQSDGVNDPARRGRTAAGESGGGGYSDGDAAPRGDGDAGGFMGHGGQSEIAYLGGGQAGHEGARAGNGVARERIGVKGAEAAATPGPRGFYSDRVSEQTREETLSRRKIEVFETSGVAAAEASGMTGKDGQERVETEKGEKPGAG